MKLKRKILFPALMLVFSVALTACSAGHLDNAESVSPASSEESVSEAVAGSEEAETFSTAEPEQTGGSVLVAYFSNTRNTEEVATQIAGLTGGTLAEIARAEEYGNLLEEAEAEILEGVHPEITVSVANVEDYDTIFVGYPI